MKRLMRASIIGHEVIIDVHDGKDMVRELVIDLKKKEVVMYNVYLEEEKCSTSLQKTGQNQRW